MKEIRKIEDLKNWFKEGKIEREVYEWISMDDYYQFTVRIRDEHDAEFLVQSFAAATWAFCDERSYLYCDCECIHGIWDDLTWKALEWGIRFKPSELEQIKWFRGNLSFWYS